ncbi:MAG: hypothetical protein KF832_21735 [Caldilineaceae bacterium]|nr:hypothetical protein [Caldilineaceae bacterium]
MFTIKNNQLTVEVLDPVADRARFGVRYCTGGYLFQIHDVNHGPLLSGPTYPHDFNWFDGQGIPDAFNLSPLKTSESEPTAMILGIGLCDLSNNTIQEPCQWQVTEQANGLVFTTEHAFHDWRVTLERTVTLLERTVRSDTLVRNIGRRPVPIRWFPHPFFPQLPTGQDELIKLNLPVGFPDSPAYALAANGFINRLGWPWNGGYFQGLDHNATTNLIIIQRHPQLGQLTATCSYAPDFFPIWGNQYTFSWEPYLERTISAGQQLSWRIDYDF